MEFLQIIIFGLIVNILMLVVMFMFGLIVTISNMFNPDFMKLTLEIQKMLNDYKSTKQMLKNKKISTITQRDFLIFIPFSYILITLHLIYGITVYGYSQTMINKIQEQHDILLSRLNENDK